MLGVRGRVLSHTRPLVLLDVRPGPTTHCLWVRGMRAWGPVTKPTARAHASCLCALWGRHEGARGGRLLPGCEAPGVGRSPTPDHSSFWACGRGPLPTGCWCGGCGRGDPSPTPQRALLRAGFALCGGGMRVPRGGRLLPGCGASGVRRSPIPDHSSFRACGRGPLATGCGCRRCGRGDPSPTPQRALLRAGFARCGGGMRAPGGSASCLGVGRLGRPLSHPRPLVLWVVRPGPTTHWLWVRGVRAWGPVTNRTARALASWLCVLWERHEGARGGRLLLGVGRPGSGAPPPSTTRPFGRAAGAHYSLAVGAGGAGVGTRHQPQSARSCELALRAVGAARGRPGGAPLAWLWGIRGPALPDPRPLVLSGVRPGPTTHWLWVRGVRAWGLVTSPTARALASCLARCGGGMRVPAGGRLLPGCGASGVGRSPSPNHSSLRACGLGPLPTGCGCSGCGREDPSPTPQRALLLVPLVYLFECLHRVVFVCK